MFNCNWKLALVRQYEHNSTEFLGLKKVPFLVSEFCWPCLTRQACRDFLVLAQTHSKRWQKALQAEREQRVRLEETLEQLAKQHNHLERAFRGAAQANTSADNKGDFGSGLCFLVHGFLHLPWSVTVRDTYLFWFVNLARIQRLSRHVSHNKTWHG